MPATIVMHCRHLNVVTGDTKNFHAWKYRSWLVERAGKSPHSEEEFTRNLLEAEPNNFSALHHRIVALAAAHSPGSTATDVEGTNCVSSRAQFQDQKAGTDTPMANADEQLPATDANMTAVSMEAESGDPQSTTATATPGETSTIHVAKMQYSGARVLPIGLDSIERELKALYEVRSPLHEIDPSSVMSLHSMQAVDRASVVKTHTVLGVRPVHLETMLTALRLSRSPQ